MIEPTVDVLERRLEQAQAKIETLEAALSQAHSLITEKDRQVRAYFSASQAVIGIESFDEAARRIFDICIGLLGATSGYIALLSADGTENEVLFLEAGGRPCTVDPSLPMPIRGLRAIAYRQRAVVYDNDFMHSEWVEMMPGGHVALDNVMFAPLNIQGKTVGVMGIANKPGGFSDHDAELAGVFGELAAIALRRARDTELLQHLTEELERSNQELEQFAYVASHDLREPLRTIIGFLDLLKMKYHDELDPQAYTYIQFAVDGSQRLRRMIEGLLTYSRVGTQPVARTPVAMDGVVDNVLLNLDRLVQETGTTITRDALPTLMADGTQLAQLLQNLLSNAIKFRGEAAPEIHIGAVEDEDGYLLSVADNGVGFDAERDGEQIFAIFQRLFTQEEVPGVGIGLAVCKRVVERHGGTIWAESRPGEGATFYVRLPRIEEDVKV
jgi:signal transduction histidine kinase